LSAQNFAKPRTSPLTRRFDDWLQHAMETALPGLLHLLRFMLVQK
jgi:hypothetical protein